MAERLPVPYLFGVRMKRVPNQNVWEKRYGNVEVVVAHQIGGAWCGFIRGARPASRIDHSGDRLHVLRSLEQQLCVIADAIGKARNA